NAVFNNNGVLEVQAGTLAFTSGYTQTAGATILNGGTLESTTTFDIQGGILSGDGDIFGVVIINGTISPGASSGIINAGGNYTLGMGTYVVELGGSTPGTGHDQVNVTGSNKNVTLGAGSVLDISIEPGFDPDVGQDFVIMTYTGTRTGQFDTLLGQGIGNFKRIEIIYDDPNKRVILTVEAVAINPTIVIEKTPDFQQVVALGTANFTITVTNTGDVSLDNVTVTDAKAPDCDSSLGTLSVGESVNYTCSLISVAQSLTNTASVTGDPPLGDSVIDIDNADVEVVNPSIDIQKTPDIQQIAVGGNATFTLTVTNTGDVDLTDVGVTDALVSDCNNGIGSLTVDAASVLTRSNGIIGNSGSGNGTVTVTGTNSIWTNTKQSNRWQWRHGCTDRISRRFCFFRYVLRGRALCRLRRSVRGR
ncbi:MAG: DUF11 domain-containing protein, partial [Planctomycetes bacterium]|nr:DUF11 domain-containing protein [Planctomycetota bacterium]